MTAGTIDQRTSFEIAEAIAPTWERRREFVEGVTAPVREWMLRELAPQPGQTLLELAAGAGDTGFGALAAAGEGARLITSDFSPTMLGVARRRGAELGVRDVEFRVIDAQRIDLEADSVDGVLCRYGYMLMDDPDAALAETRRVLRHGGRLVLAVWGAPDRNPFFASLGMALVRAGHMPPPDPSRPGPFTLADPDGLRGRLERAGFGSVRVDEVGVRFRVAGAREYVEVSADTSGPLAMVLRGLTDDQRRALTAELEGALAPFAAGGGYEVPGLTIVAAAS